MSVQKRQHASVESSVVRPEAWSFVIDAAFTLREILVQQGFDHSWPKLTGGKGIHIMVPLSELMSQPSARCAWRSNLAFVIILSITIQRRS